MGALDIRGCAESAIRGAKRLVAGTAIVVMIMPAGISHASEYGIGTYRPGQVDLFAGMLPAPGGAAVKNYFLFQQLWRSAALRF